jgi:hypothetical protein
MLGVSLDCGEQRRVRHMQGPARSVSVLTNRVAARAVLDNLLSNAMNEQNVCDWRSVNS